MKTIKELEARLLFETKQSNEFRMRRGESKTADQKKAWQTLIDLADESKKELRTKIETMKNQGLKKPSVRGLKTLCSNVVKATGLKVDGTLKKGFKYIKGGKVVKTTPTPNKTKKVCAKKPVTKQPAVKKIVAKKKPVAKKLTAKTKK
ncbi:hypothetical protein [Flavobacterium sp. I-STPA6A]|uniref:hypothetical protein n=1 Tax=Flavobacterium sp. I-STPA6A TaxID=2590450 RepID=UPI0018EF04FB|nr:hypothetical protein [Flavobacterium sp. I-STPA6A]